MLVISIVMNSELCVPSYIPYNIYRGTAGAVLESNARSVGLQGHHQWWSTPMRQSALVPSSTLRKAGTQACLIVR